MKYISFETQIIPNHNPAIVAPVIYRQNSFEHVLAYQKSGDEHVEIALSHVYCEESGAPTTPTLGLASYRTVNNPNMVPSAKIELSMDEARMLRDFLNRPEVLAYLDEER